MDQYLMLLKEHKEQFNLYYNELVETNKKFNLTAITEEQEVYIKHFLDSILAHEFIPKNANIIDIGTGAGFPGLPLKIIRDDINLTLVDSLNKRVEFLKSLTSKLNLNVDCVHARAEDYAKQNREKHDVLVARAVAGLNTLLEYALPLIKTNGYFLAYKGSNYQEELNNCKKALEVLGGRVEKVEIFDLPNNAGKRAIIIIKKIKSTPAKFPRGKNLPKLKPIL